MAYLVAKGADGSDRILYRVTVKASPRARKTEAWDRFGRNEDELREATERAVAAEYPAGGVILRIDTVPVEDWKYRNAQGALTGGMRIVD